MVSVTPRPYLTPGKDPLPIVQETGWSPRPVWKCGKSRPKGIRSPDRPARSESLYRLSYRAHNGKIIKVNIHSHLHNMKAYGGMEVYHHSLLIAKQEEEEWTASHKGGGCNAGNPSSGNLKDLEPALFCVRSKG